MGRTVRFNLLGPVSVSTDAGPVALPAGIPRGLLVLLLLHANAVVPAKQLAELLWGEEQPATSAAALRNHVSRLRRQLGEQAGARVRTVAPGYLVEVGEGELDAQVFTEACGRGRRALVEGDHAAAAAILSDALLMWRGEPLADLPPGADVAAEAQRLDETRLLALEGRIEADLCLGRHRELVAELRTLVGAHPLREALHGQLMLALYRAERQAEALEVFQGLRRTLVGELGVEPSGPVQELCRRILAADPALASPTGEAVPVPASGSQYQLPAEARSFTGRAREVEELLGLAREVPGGGGAVVVSAVAGMAGMGKSALAVHVAHRLRARFPDGQLFVDLHGHTPGIAPLAPGDALDWFLRSLGVAPQLIPQDPDERAAFYRARLADTRTLIVLDNAAGTAQVRPLLPGAPGCMVIVTSRRRLTGLDDAHTMALDVLADDEAVDLVHRVAGPGRIPPDDPAVGELIALCGHMPLALRLTAARLRHHRALRLADVVEQLRDEQGRLSYLQDDERDLTAVFESSYAGLPPAEQQLFRRLALVPGPDADVDAAANLVGGDRRGTERLLESLLDHNLLIQHTPGRYRFHDLVRLYARTLSDAEPAAERDAARSRLLDYYHYTARTADHHLRRYHRPGAPPVVPVPASAPRLADQATALTWMRAERDNLFAAIQLTIVVDPPRAIALTGTLAAFLHQEGPLPFVTALHRSAADVAHDRAEYTSEANAYHDLGHVHVAIGTYLLAADALEKALTIYQGLGDRLGEANTLHDLSRIRHMVGDFTGAAPLQERALLLFQGLGDRLGEGNALHDLGRTRLMMGDFSAAADLERALEIFRGIHHSYGEANALWTLGRLRAMTGDYASAGDLLHQALAIFQRIGSRLGESNSLYDLGRVQLAIGAYPASSALLEQALAICRALGFRANEGHALSDLSLARSALGDHPAAALLQEQALVVFQEIGSRQGEATALHELGRIARANGELPDAAELLGRAMRLFRELGDRRGQTQALNSTGALLAGTGRLDEALALHRQALELARGIHSPLDEARALEGIAHCAALSGDRDTALADLHRAATLYRRLGVPEAAEAAARLAALEQGAPTGAR